MNIQTKLEVKKFFLAILLFFSLFLFLAGLQFLMNPYAESGLKQSANLVLHDWNEKSPALGDALPSNNIGWTYKIYATEGKGKKTDRVFIVRLTGNTGPYTGVFYYTVQTGTEFCGLAGISGLNKPAKYYGITNRIIARWIDTLDTIAEQAGPTK